jgi:hypothetical protein
VLVVEVDVVLVDDVEVVLVVDVVLLDVDVVDDEGDVGATVAGDDEVVDPVVVVVAPGSADWIRSLHATSNNKPASVGASRRPSITGTSRPIARPPAVRSRPVRAPNNRRDDR